MFPPDQPAEKSAFNYDLYAVSVSTWLIRLALSFNNTYALLESLWVIDWRSLHGLCSQWLQERMAQL